MAEIEPILTKLDARFSIAPSSVRTIVREGSYTSEATEDERRRPLVAPEAPPKPPPPTAAGIGMVSHQPKKATPPAKRVVAAGRNKFGRILAVTVEEIRALREQGLTFRQIGERLGCDGTTAYKRFRGSR